MHQISHGIQKQKTDCRGNVENVKKHIEDLTTLKTKINIKTKLIDIVLSFENGLTVR